MILRIMPPTHRGMRFGIFLAPFHRVGENPTLALNRDMELIEWLDYLGYDEVWVGEHHSAGWELIASPELFIAAAAERTRHIMLGSGVTSLPYHHPYLVAERFVQLDHMTRGRAMLGCGPGALVSDAYMLGIEPVTQRPRMDEALDAIMELLKCEEPVTVKTDWFEMRQARLHLAPYTHPHFPIAVASVMTPVRRDRGRPSRSRRAVARRGAAGWAGGAGQSVEDRRGDGGQARQAHGPQGVAPGRQRPRGRRRRGGAPAGQARRAPRDGHVLRGDARAVRPGRSDDPLTEGVKMGTTLVGGVETVIKAIEHLETLSAGGFGGLLFRAHEWATREQTLRSYELFARYVMPRFQGSLDSIRGSNEWARGNRKTIFGPNVEAIKRAYTDAGREVPAEVMQRTSGARDEGPVQSP